MKYDCYYSLPHDLKPLKEFKDVKIEQCVICSKIIRWNKDYKGRVDNKKYLEAHIRNFAQEFGRTKRIFNKIYHPEKMVIRISFASAK